MKCQGGSPLPLFACKLQTALGSDEDCHAVFGAVNTIPVVPLSICNTLPDRGEKSLFCGSHM